LSEAESGGVFPRELFGVIARESGQSSTHDTAWNACSTPSIGCGVLDRPLARTMTTVVGERSTQAANFAINRA